MRYIKTTILTSLLATQLIYSATSEEIENYLTLSKADSKIIEIEQAFDSMRADEDNSSQEINQIYTQYLEEHFSSNEIEELLALYRTPIMQRYVIEMDMVDIPNEEMETFLLSLEENPLSTERMEVIENILKYTIHEKDILAFYASMTQRYQTEKKEDNKSKKRTKEEEKFLNMMKESAKNELLYGTQTFSIEEMNELDKSLKSSIISKASQVESKAMIQVMDSFIKNIVSKPKKNKPEENRTKQNLGQS